MLYSGIDEAGLGPVLGPYCATSTTFSAPSPIKDLVADNQKKLFYIDDSKKVYKGSKGFYTLELNVLSLYFLLFNEIPTTSLNFIPSLDSIWNKEESLNLPIQVESEKIIKTANLIKTYFNSKDIKIIDIKRTAVSPTNFNRLIDSYDNKSTVCQRILEPLISHVNSFKEDHNIIIDKQGGRKFYKEYIDSITGKNFVIEKEEDIVSTYSSTNKKLHFMAKADSNSFEVALSSMFSKYMREVSMLSFNNYWQKRLPNIKKTAGYYVDGLRFLSEIKNSKDFPEDLDTILRKK